MCVGLFPPQPWPATCAMLWSLSPPRAPLSPTGPPSCSVTVPTPPGPYGDAALPQGLPRPPAVPRPLWSRRPPPLCHVQCQAKTVFLIPSPLGDLSPSKLLSPSDKHTSGSSSAQAQPHLNLLSFVLGPWPSRLHCPLRPILQGKTSRKRPGDGTGQPGSELWPQDL